MAILGQLAKVSLSTLKKSRSIKPFFIDSSQVLIKSGSYFFNSFKIVDALNKKIPLFQRWRLPSMKVFALSKEGFSINFLIFVDEICSEISQ